MPVPLVNWIVSRLDSRTLRTANVLRLLVLVITLKNDIGRKRQFFISLVFNKNTVQMARTTYKWFNINIIGPGKRVNGKSGKAETTIFWPHYSGKCRTVGTYSPRRHHGRATASRQTEKTVDTRHWRVDWLRIHSAKGDVTRSSTMEKKDIGVVICCRQPSSRKVD